MYIKIEKWILVSFKMFKHLKKLSRIFLSSLRKFLQKIFRNQEIYIQSLLKILRLTKI